MAILLRVWRLAMPTKLWRKKKGGGKNKVGKVSGGGETLNGIHPITGVPSVAEASESWYLVKGPGASRILP